MKNLLILAFAACLIAACQKPTVNVNNESMVDSLILAWNNAWNNHDSLAIENMFEPTGVLIDGDSITRNTAELSKLVRSGINTINNLKTEPLQKWATADRAGLAGLWELDAIANDSVIAHPKGAFTFNWRKTENGDWKLTNADIHSFSK